MPYRKFDTGTWHDKNFEALEPMERYLFIYLWTNDITPPSGIYDLSLRRMSFDTKLPSTDLQGYLVNLGKMVEYDTMKQVVFVKKFHKRQCQNKDFAKSALQQVVDGYPQHLQEFVLINKSIIKKYKLQVPQINPPTLEAPLNPPTMSISNSSSNSNRTEKDKEKTNKKEKSIKPEILENSDNLIDEIIQDLNQVTGRGFRTQTESYRKLVAGLLRKGFIFEQFHQVHIHRAKKWLGDPKYQEFLRPQTLYGNKFDAYLQAATNGTKTIISETQRHNLQVAERFLQDETV
ncbi:MAG: hypothetical protein GY841_18040 [FCB group bacterium]|nr:hypothetical protein [FCB group bacterium]